MGSPRPARTPVSLLGATRLKQVLNISPNPGPTAPTSTQFSAVPTTLRARATFTAAVFGGAVAAARVIAEGAVIPMYGYCSATVLCYLTAPGYTAPVARVMAVRLTLLLYSQPLFLTEP